MSRRRHAAPVGASRHDQPETWRTGVRDAAVGQLGYLEGHAFAARLDVVHDDLVEALTAVYGDRADIETMVQELCRDSLAAAVARPLPLRRLDRCREVDPGWFLDERMVGYVCYVDRYAGTLAGVTEHLDHLSDLGVTYLHLMPLLRTREGENDGGYAVADYDEVDPQLGTMADLQHLAEQLHERDIALCVDLVLNHTAREHEWARKALGGDPVYRDFYRFFPDRNEPDAYEATLPEVFPDMAPGSFSNLPETDEWVWTTFHEFQWDLNWANPEVFRAMLGVLLRMANRGVDVVRLDAAPFLWKQVGTSCQNLPEAHRILQALRALVQLAAPGMLLKAEAIVGPDDLMPYLGRHDLYRPECHLAYDNQLMVMLWSALAARDVRLTVHSLARRPASPPGSGWVSYVRCHDDIGWAVSDEDAWAVGVDPFGHRQFLAAFYAGRHPGSFARGADFQVNLATGDARTSGSAASLAGLEAALESSPDGQGAQVDAALARLELLYAMAYAVGGMPLLYMGDEIAMLNDPAWAEDPDHAEDNRWLHRPPMDWAAAEAARAPGGESTPAGRIFEAMRRLSAARTSTEAIRSDATTEVLDLGSSRVLACVRHHPRAEPLLVLGCFSDHPEMVDTAVLDRAGIEHPVLLHTGSVQPCEQFDPSAGVILLPPWSYVWVTDTA